MTRRIATPREERSPRSLLRFDKLTAPRKIEGQPANVKTVAIAPAGASVQPCVKTDLGLT